MANWYDSLVGGANYLAGGVYSALTGKQNYSNYQAPAVTTPAQRQGIQYVTLPVAVSPGQVAGATTTNQGGGTKVISHEDAMRQGLDVNNLPAGYSMAGTSAGVGSETPSFDWNSIYQPQIDALTAQENTAREAQLSSLQTIGETSASQKKNLELTGQEAEQTYESQLAKAQRSSQSAYELALRDFNALMQNKRARFGAASSAGQAVGEIGQQEYFRNQGQVAQSYEEIFANLLNQKASVNKFLLQKNSEIDDWVRQSTEDVKLKLQDTLNQIGTQKAQVESAKASQKMQAFQDALTYARQIAAIKEQAKTSLDTWKQQQDYLIQNQLVQLYSNPVNTNIASPTTSSLSAPTSQTGVGNIRWNPNLKRFEDEFGNVVSY